jgi:hypothetical protein
MSTLAVANVAGLGGWREAGVARVNADGTFDLIFDEGMSVDRATIGWGCRGATDERAPEDTVNVVR